MKGSFKDQHFCVVDNGLFCDLSRMLAPLVGKSSYYSRWENAFPSLFQAKIGEYPGVNRVNDYFDVIDDADTFIFPDILFAGLQNHLEKIGKAVWGARYGEDLENWRIEFRELCKELGIGTPEYTVCHGVSELEKILEKQQDRWIKISLYRGNMETWHSKNIKLSQAKIDKLSSDLGPWKEKQEFLVEKPIPKSVEVAFDTYLIDGKPPGRGCFGLEVKSEALFMMMLDYNQFPQQILDLNERLAPTFKDYHFRGNAPIELRVKEDGSYVALDPCMREGSPSFESKLKLISNWPEIYHAGARGEVVDPETTDGATCAMQLILYSDWAKTEATAIHIPPKYRDNLVLRYACEVDGVLYVLPQPVNNANNGVLSANSTLGSIVTIGKTWQECRDQIDEIKGEVEAEGLFFYSDALDKTKVEWEKLKDYGIKLPKL